MANIAALMQAFRSKQCHDRDIALLSFAQSSLCGTEWETAVIFTASFETYTHCLPFAFCRPEARSLRKVPCFDQLYSACESQDYNKKNRKR